jgi:hypothetical protein
MRKAGLHKRSTASSPGFTVVAEAGSCFIRAASAEVAIQYHHVGSFVPAERRLPLDALDAIDGKQGDVTFQTDGRNRTLLAWTDHGVPRQASFDAPKLAPFPEVPTSFAMNERTLWSALRDALPVTDKRSNRLLPRRSSVVRIRQSEVGDRRRDSTARTGSTCRRSLFAEVLAPRRRSLVDRRKVQVASMQNRLNQPPTGG